ncbi:MAG: DUF1850 domain-containing protein [Clostridiaceae bacterium]
MVGSLFIIGHRERKLMIYDADTKEVFASWRVDEGSRFSVEFIHSVNKSPVKDEFEIRSNEIYAYKTTYSSFGAGVQTELREGESLSYNEEGDMVITGFDMMFVELNIIVGTVSDHILFINGEEFSLTELCGKNKAIVIDIR